MIAGQTAGRTYAEGSYAGVYTGYTSEELYNFAKDGDETALWTLCRKYEPLFKSEAKLYRNKMAEAYDTEDFISIGYILVWDITKKRNFSETIDGGKASFGGYLKQAVRWRYSKLFTDYSLKNLICTGEAEDCRGNLTRTYAVDEKAEIYKEQQRERSRRSYDRKAAEIDRIRAEQGLTPIYRPSRATEEEKTRHDEEVKARRNERVKAYQKEHQEEIRARKAEYYQKNKERYRLNDAVLRTKNSIAKFEAAGNEKAAAKARERLMKYEKERDELISRA